MPISADDTYTILLHLFSEGQLGTFDKRSLQKKIIYEAIIIIMGTSARGWSPLEDELYPITSSVHNITK